MKKRIIMVSASVLMLALIVTVQHPLASSHREALAVLNDPCVDNTDVYAWVTPGLHDKMYLIAGYNGLHEPGQGNQQTRLCDDVLYEFHITRGIGDLEDKVTYQIDFNSTPPTSVDAGDLSLPPGGGKELLIQLGGVRQTYNVTKIEHSNGWWKRKHRGGDDDDDDDLGAIRTVIGRNIPVAPPNIGPQTDRLAYGLGTFQPYQAGGSPESREEGLYNDAFAATFIKPLGPSGSEGRAWAGTRDDGFYLDEKGIFDIINLAGLGGIGGRRSPGEDVFAGFNLNVIALEIPTNKLTGTGRFPAHNGRPGDDTLLGVWASASRRKVRVLHKDGEPTTDGPWVQVGREGLPLIDAAMIGVQDQSKYLRTTPVTDVENFATYFLNPILVRDAEALGIYSALGLPQATIDSLKSGRVDILKAINLDNLPTPDAHHVPITPGTTGDVLRVDIATDSQFPNGRMIPGKFPNAEQVDVSDALLTLIVSGGAIEIGDGVNHNDKDYLTEFPWLALPWQGLNEGHGAPAP
jgi:hypothetical protein